MFRQLKGVHAEIAACRKCAEAGFFAESSPVVVNQPVCAPRLMLVGQAPAIPLRSQGKPFSGQAGRVLFGWLARAGFSEDEFRAQCYFTAITKCYPGPAAGGVGKGDRVPSGRERELCEPFLQRELAIMEWAAKMRDERLLIITAGRLATTYFLGKEINFTEAIGQSFERDGCIILPLPHPSGVSRWTNDPDNQIRLARALTLLRSLTSTLTHAA